MSAYIIRRLLQGLVKIVIISFIMFVLTNLSGDPVAQFVGPRTSAADRERIRQSLGLNQSIPMRYVGWIGLAVQGNFGFSFSEHRPVSEMLRERLPDTLLLTGMAELVLIIISLGVGIYQATHQYSLFDNLLTGFSFVGISMPVFFVGLGLLLIFAVGAKELNTKGGWTWLPYFPTGTKVWDRSSVGNWIYYMILPIATLTIIQVAGYARFVRASLLEVMSQDYIRVARAKGLVENVVVAKHALKNAALPFVTLIGLDLPVLLAGAVVTESVFSWRGMGRLFINSAENSDFPVVMGILMMVTVGVIIVQLLVDVLYTLLDPRIKLS